MKLLCDSCDRLAAPAAWAAVEGGLRLTCGACGHVHLVPPPLTASHRDPAPPPAAPTVPDDAAEGAWMERGWLELRERWDEAAAHEKLIAAAAAQNALQDLGRRYRDVLEREPRNVRALAAREALIRRATQELMVRAPAQQPGAEPRRVRSLFFAFVTLVLLGVSAWLLLRGGGALPPPP